MSRGINSVSVSGNVGLNVVHSHTTAGEAACSFPLAVEKKFGKVVWMIVNAYDRLAEDCLKKLKVGGYVVVKGELISGKHGEDDMSVQVKAYEIAFVDPTGKNSEGGKGEEKRFSYYRGTETDVRARKD